MIFNRYKGKNWRLAYEHSANRLLVFIESKTDSAAAYEAQMFLKAYYKGPWRMIAAVLQRELASAVTHYCWPKWEWLRVKLFRRPQDESLAIQARVEQEKAAIEALARELR